MPAGTPNYRDEFLDSRNVALLGDAHMGRPFFAGVPLDRRGERERMQYEDLARALADSARCRLHVNMGDLFNKAYVPYEDIQRVASLYIDAAERNPGTTYIILAGNHDSGRNKALVSALDLFGSIVARCWNIEVVKNQPFVLDDLAFLPWTAHETALELAAKLQGSFAAVFGHWDVLNQGPNHVPVEALAGRVERIYTGHEHLPGTSRIAGIPVIRTGSMQPYSHGEDPERRLYITLTLPEVQAALAADPGCFRMMCLRIALQPGEMVPEKLDCLQLGTMLIGQDDDAAAPEVASLDGFNMEERFQAALASHNVGPAVREQLEARFGLSREALAAI